LAYISQTVSSLQGPLKFCRHFSCPTCALHVSLIIQALGLSPVLAAGYILWIHPRRCILCSLVFCSSDLHTIIS